LSIPACQQLQGAPLDYQLLLQRRLSRPPEELSAEIKPLHIVYIYYFFIICSKINNKS